MQAIESPILEIKETVNIIKSEADPQTSHEPSPSTSSTTPSIVLSTQVIEPANDVIVDNMKDEIQMDNENSLDILTNPDELTLNRLNTTATEVEVSTIDTSEVKMDFDTEIMTE